MDQEKMNKKLTAQEERFEALLRTSLADTPVPAGFADSVMQRIAQENIQIERTNKVRRFPLPGTWIKGMVAVAAAGIVFLGAQNLDFTPAAGPEMAENPGGHEITEWVEKPGEDIEPTVETPGVEEPSVDAQIPEGETDPENPVPTEPGLALPDESDTVERDVDPVDLSKEVRLDAVVSIASEAGRLPAGTLDLTPLYTGENRALAPSITDANDVLYFIENADGTFNLVRQSVKDKDYTLVTESLTSAKVDVKEAMVRPISQSDLTVREDAVYYKDIQILPSLMDAELEYGLAPNDIFVIVNAKSDIPAIEGLWVTDIYNANMGKLSVLGGGRILAFAPDSSSFLFTDREGSIYLGDIMRAKTYLVAEKGDVGDTVANYSADGNSFVISGRVDGVDGIYYVQVP